MFRTHLISQSSPSRFRRRISALIAFNWLSVNGALALLMGLNRKQELEDENRRLIKMYVEERLKADILREAIEKSGETVSTT